MVMKGDAKPNYPVQFYLESAIRCVFSGKGLQLCIIPYAKETLDSNMCRKGHVVQR